MVLTRKLGWLWGAIHAPDLCAGATESSARLSWGRVDSRCVVPDAVQPERMNGTTLPGTTHTPPATTGPAVQIGFALTRNANSDSGAVDPCALAGEAPTTNAAIASKPMAKHFCR